MKLSETKLVKIEAEEGMILVSKIDGYGAKLLYLGIYDSPDNYKEIPEEDYIPPEPEQPQE